MSLKGAIFPIMMFMYLSQLVKSELVNREHHLSDKLGKRLKNQIFLQMTPLKQHYVSILP